MLGLVSRRVDTRALGYNVTAFLELSIYLIAKGTADLHRITHLILETPGLMRTTTSIASPEAMPPRLNGLLQRAAQG